MAIADLSGGTPICLNKAGLKLVGFDSWEEARASAEFTTFSPRTVSS
jgi:hypothetical protein